MATIIKPESLQQSSGTALRHVAYDLTDMAAEADTYLDQVRREAAKIVEQARRDAAAIRRQAEDSGRRAAEAAIERVLDDKVAKQMQTLTPAFKAAIEQIRDAKQEWQQHWESAVVGLAAAIAGRLIRTELAQRPTIPLEWIREALELAAGSGELAIHLHADDVRALDRQVQSLAALTHPTATVRLVADETITPGGCRVVTEFGNVDMQLEAQLARMRQELN